MNFLQIALVRKEFHAEAHWQKANKNLRTKKQNVFHSDEC